MRPIPELLFFRIITTQLLRKNKLVTESRSIDHHHYYFFQSNCCPGVDLEIESSSSFISGVMFSKRGVLRYLSPGNNSIVVVHHRIAERKVRSRWKTWAAFLTKKLSLSYIWIIIMFYDLCHIILYIHTTYYSNHT